MEGDKYSIYGAAKRAICPVCSGMLDTAAGGMDLVCIDCRSAFQLYGEGIADKEMLYVQINEGSRKEAGQQS